MKPKIRKDYLISLPFGKIQSRHAIAMMLSYFGSNEEVYDIMRRTSHKTRAYIINAEGLKGFLVPYSVTSALRILIQNRNQEHTKAVKY